MKKLSEKDVKSIKDVLDLLMSNDGQAYFRRCSVCGVVLSISGNEQHEKDCKLDKALKLLE